MKETYKVYLKEYDKEKIYIGQTGTYKSARNMGMKFGAINRSCEVIIECDEKEVDRFMVAL